jgi:Putative auto-transporter adhesin, head GIN domain
MIKSYFGVDCLILDVACDVEIRQSRDFSVELIGQDAEKNISINPNGGDLKISQKNAGGGFSFSNGNVVMSGSGNISVSRGGGKSVVIRNGEVYINGKRVSEDGSIDSSPAPIPPRIVIHCPDGLSLDASMTGDGKLASLACWKTANLRTLGCGEAAIVAKKLKVKISGSSHVMVVCKGGGFNAQISGSGDIRAQGEFEDVDLSISGSGNISTSGRIAGDLDASVSGSGRISHSGHVQGRKSQRVTGTGRISI